MKYLAGQDEIVQEQSNPNVPKHLIGQLNELSPIAPQPYLYTWYLRTRAFGTPLLVSGGWYDQPYISSTVIETCYLAEKDYARGMRISGRQ